MVLASYFDLPGKSPLGGCGTSDVDECTINNEDERCRIGDIFSVGSFSTPSGKVRESLALVRNRKRPGKAVNLRSLMQILRYPWLRTKMKSCRFICLNYTKCEDFKNTLVNYN